MAPSKIFGYKPADYITYNLSSKRLAPQPGSLKTNALYDFTDVFIEKLEAREGATGSSNLRQKLAGDTMATVEDGQAYGDDLVGIREALIADSDDDTDDDDIPSMTRSPSGCKQRLAGERPLEEIDDRALDDNGFPGSKASGTQGKPTILDGDDGSRDGDDDLHTRPSPRTLSGQRSNVASNLETTPVLPNRTANERDHGINSDRDDASNTPVTEAAAELNKPADPATHGPWCDVEGGGYVDDDLRPIPPLEQDGLASTPAQYHARPQFEGPRSGKGKWKLMHLGTPGSDEQCYISQDEGRAVSTFVECASASPASFPLGASEPAPPPELQLAAEMINANQDWEVRAITGKEDVNGVSHYLVEWVPTLLPERFLGHAKALVDGFEARLRAQRGVKNGRGAGLKRGEQAVIEVDSSGGQQKKRRRGRPQKQA